MYNNNNEPSVALVAHMDDTHGLFLLSSTNISSSISESLLSSINKQAAAKSRLSSSLATNAITIVCYYLLVALSARDDLGRERTKRLHPSISWPIRLGRISGLVFCPANNQVVTQKTATFLSVKNYKKNNSASVSYPLAHPYAMNPSSVHAP